MPGVARRALAGLLLALAFGVEGGCSNTGSAPPNSAATPETAGEPSPAPGVESPSSPAEKAEATSSGDDELDDMIADIAAEAEAGDAEQADEGAQDPLSGRDVTYRVTPKGLIIEVDGFHIRPRVKPFKKKHGGYALEIELELRSFDGRDYWVRSPKEGPLGLAGRIETKKGKRTRFRDQRSGDEKLMIGGSEEVVVLKQVWPGKKQPQLWWGETLSLEAGLWGLKAPGDAGFRPIQRLFAVKMLGTNDPQPVISPPTMDWGS